MNHIKACFRFFPSFILAFFCLLPLSLFAGDIYLTGQVTSPAGVAVSGAAVTFTVNSKDFSSTSDAGGMYSIRLSGIYPPEPGLFEVDVPFPNPFSFSTNIPFIISGDGDIRFSVYDLGGRKIREMVIPGLTAGSYRLVWDGTAANGSPCLPGFYIYALTFRGITHTGRLVKAIGVSAYAAPGGIEMFMPPPSGPVSPGEGYAVPAIAAAQKQGYHTTRLTDITIRKDTVINLVICPMLAQPFKTLGDYIARNDGQQFIPMILKGINLGSSPPGTFPGEIAYAITPAMYEQWIEMMVQAGFNTVRVYTLHPPVFYEKLAEYNLRHPAKPLYLFQGIWLEEVADPFMPREYDLMNRVPSFTMSVYEVIDCMHGNKTIAFRPGKAYGRYRTDVSAWIAGYIIGREISPQEVDSTDRAHPQATAWAGNYLSITGARASEVFVTRMLDQTVSYEWNSYVMKRPVSISSWPTLDPLVHPTEIHTDEDKASIDITRIVETGGPAYLFASYHAYPYYPDFISDDPLYRTYSDGEGPNSYLGYLTALKSHYSSLPLVIAEFGVPSSWGSAHQSFSNMHHGGLSETQQGTMNIRLMNNIIDAGCSGGFMFAWMDEWFKRTWIVEYLEAYSSWIGGQWVPTRQLWHNVTSPEQNFGLIAFEQEDSPSWNSYTMQPSGSTVRSIKCRHDNAFFYLDIETSAPVAAGDTLMIAFDTYLEDVGESVLPGGMTIANRSEFLLEAVRGEDTVSFYVTGAYDMCGLTPRFDLSDPLVQKYMSTVSDGGPWRLMQWINSGFSGSVFDIGRLPAEEGETFSAGGRAAVAWHDQNLYVRIPWTMLHFFDPTQRLVIDGAISYDGGYHFEILTRLSDGIALSVRHGTEVVHTQDRYTWPTWLVVPPARQRVKHSFSIVSDGLKNIPDRAR